MGIVLQIPHAELQEWRQGLLYLQAPDGALGREIAVLRALKNEWMLDLHLPQGIQIEKWPGRDLAVGAVHGDVLVRVFIEAVDVQGDAVEKQPVSGLDQGACMGKRAPRNARPRRHAERFRHVLRFGAHAEIQGQPRRNNPMVLSVKGVLDIRDLKRVAPGEVDAFDPLFHRSQDVYRVLVQLAVLRASREIGPDLQVVRSPSGRGKQRSSSTAPLDRDASRVLLAK